MTPVHENPRTKKRCACCRGNVTPIQLSMLFFILFPTSPPPSVIPFQPGVLFFPPYRWCSVLRSSPGCIHTCRPGTSRARCSVGDTLADHRPLPSTPPRSGRCLRHRCRVRHSPRHKSLWERRKERDRGRGRVGVKREIQNVVVMKRQPHSTTSPDGE